MPFPTDRDAVNAAFAKLGPIKVSETPTGYLIVADVDRRELEVMDRRDIPAFFSSIIELIIAAAAGAYFADYKAKIYAAMSPEAIANLAVADAARHLREETLTPSARPKHLDGYTDDELLDFVYRRTPNHRRLK